MDESATKHRGMCNTACGVFLFYRAIEKKKSVKAQLDLQLNL